MADRMVSILDGNTFVVSDQRGDIEASPTDTSGLFSYDTRFLSRWVLTVNGERLNTLSIDDLNYFNGWLEARQAGNTQLAAIYRRRFRPEFVPAFRAWIAQRPFTNPRAIPGPLSTTAISPRPLSAQCHATSMRPPSGV